MMLTSNRIATTKVAGYAEPTLAGWAHEVWRQELTTKRKEGAASSVSIFLGPQQTAGSTRWNELNQANVRAIVNCTPRFPNHHVSSGVRYARVSVNDEAGANILVFLDGAADFIHHALTVSSVSVLVHCQVGASRSATIVLAYLIKYHNLTRDEAFLHVKERRPLIQPNPGFWEQLYVYEQRIRRRQSQTIQGQDTEIQTMIDFNAEWAQTSVARFQTLSSILTNGDSGQRLDLFPELRAYDQKVIQRRREILEVAVDHVLGRGVLESDLEWLCGLCKVLDQYSVTGNIESRSIQRQTGTLEPLPTSSSWLVETLLTDPQSKVVQDWEGELRPTMVGRVVDAVQRLSTTHPGNQRK